MKNHSSFRQTAILSILCGMVIFNSISNDIVVSRRYTDFKWIELDSCNVAISLSGWTWPGQNVAPRVLLKLPREFEDISAIAEDYLYGVFFYDNQYIFTQRQYYPTDDFNKFKWVKDTTYTPSDGETLDFINKLINITIYNREELRDLKRDNFSEYKYTLFKNHILLYKVPQLVDMIEHGEIINSGENRIIVRKGLRILLFNIHAKEIKRVEGIVSNSKILSLNNLELMEVKKARWYKEDSTKIHYLISEPNYLEEFFKEIEY